LSLSADYNKHHVPPYVIGEGFNPNALAIASVFRDVGLIAYSLKYVQATGLPEISRHASLHTHSKIGHMTKHTKTF